MKARPIIKRNQPIEFPVLAEWTINDQTIADRCVVLFTENRLGIAVVHNNPKNCEKFTRAWVPLDWKGNGKRSWRILGAPEKFGIRLNESKDGWTGTFSL